MTLIEEIQPDLFRIEIPLPKSPLKYLNSYVIKSDKRHLVVDTGFDIQECYQAMLAGLNTLDIDLDRTDFFITHLHMDHLGLVPRLATLSSTVYFNYPDAHIIRNWQGHERFAAFGALQGFPIAAIQKAMDIFRRFKLHPGLVEDFSLLNDGDSVQAGDYHFRCIQTPGHTIGHLCLFDSDHKLLISGDHLLRDISPSIQCWNDDHNPLQWYLDSLEKIYELDIDMVLPGHRSVIFDHKTRIDELKSHHRLRCNEIVEILDAGPMSAYGVAARMNWSIHGDSWQAYPLEQQWFAMGEAMSHLKYLESDGRIVYSDKNGRRTYALS